MGSASSLWCIEQWPAHRAPPPATTRCDRYLSSPHMKPSSHARLTRSQLMRNLRCPCHVQKLAMPFRFVRRLLRQWRSRRAPSRSMHTPGLAPNVPLPNLVAVQLLGHGLEALKNQAPVGIEIMGWNLGRHPSRPASAANAAWREPSLGL